MLCVCKSWKDTLLMEDSVYIGKFKDGLTDFLLCCKG